MSIKIYNSVNHQIDSNTIRIVNQYKDQLNLIITIGGDGSILGAEKKFPGIPKLPLRFSNICNHCKSQFRLESLIQDIINKRIQPKRYIKLQANFKKQTFIALNEINIKAKNPRSALRFQVSTSPVDTTLLADGLIVATPFGSTGYFKSISNTVFVQGIGVALNNPTNQQPTKIVSEDTSISVKIIRGPAMVFVDNQPEFWQLQKRENLTIKKSLESALIY
ncbi:hypothetical protein DRH14_03210 [Candidatus Shapirobacteria bacterium]|nr:MAG: hypothetical protein DRH14_03210 [Candidatus Shapirobacteria bacterium]